MKNTAMRNTCLPFVFKDVLYFESGGLAGCPGLQ